MKMSVLEIAKKFESGSRFEPFLWSDDVPCESSHASVDIRLHCDHVPCCIESSEPEPEFHDVDHVSEAYQWLRAWRLRTADIIERFLSVNCCDVEGPTVNNDSCKSVSGNADVTLRCSSLTSTLCSINAHSVQPSTVQCGFYGPIVDTDHAQSCPCGNPDCFDDGDHLEDCRRAESAYLCHLLLDARDFKKFVLHTGGVSSSALSSLHNALTDCRLFYGCWLSRRNGRRFRDASGLSWFDFVHVHAYDMPAALKWQDELETLDKDQYIRILSCFDKVAGELIR
eukprot:TRINITY_DN47732_c0_g1_i1.p1 TRINITY_DN47732_c0_g1~~TRINITY_DN47732_c0_g1_i1.p1  ORF type:complete len:283 (-),score=4.70 TRINITY_DN47732_c0_g1_i1:165-1013(-)